MRTLQLYVVLHNTYSTGKVGKYQLLEALDLKDCCIQYLNYHGELTYIIEKGFNAFSETLPAELIKYTNLFLSAEDEIINIIKVDSCALPIKINDIGD